MPDRAPVARSCRSGAQGPGPGTALSHLVTLFTVLGLVADVVGVVILTWGELAPDAAMLRYYWERDDAGSLCRLISRER